MKLLCDITIKNTHYLDHAIVPKSRAKKSQINVLKNDKNEIFMVIQSRDNKTGTRYNITNNLSQTFVRFMSEGKCTLKLKQPAVELSLNNCDPLQLRIFLKIIREIDNSGADSSNTKLIDNLPSVHKKLKSTDLTLKSRTELCILTKQELCTTHFSHLLVKLEIVGLALQHIPPSVSKLPRLQILNLSGNKLKTLPSSMTLQLRELNIAGNLLGQAPYKTWKFFSQPQTKSSLQNLDLSDNQLPYIPMDICNLRQLVKLELRGNCIRCFPPSFGDFPRLRHLDISNNKIEKITSNFQLLKLDVLDISGNNQWHGVVNYEPFPIRYVPSLLQIAAVMVVKTKLPQHALPRSLQEDLQILNRCWCLQPVWHSDCSVIPLNLSKISTHVISDGSYTVYGMGVYFCNTRCQRRL